MSEYQAEPTGAPFYDRRDVIDMNVAFAHAMLAARREGLERFTIGVIKDDSPIRPVHFASRVDYSPMGSGAAMCLDDHCGNSGGMVSARPMR